MERFAHINAIPYEKANKGRTYILVDSDMYPLGYFTLGLGRLEYSADIPERLWKKLRGVGDGDATVLSCILLGQLSRNDGISYGESVLFYPGNPDYVILQDAGLMVQRYDLGCVDWGSARLLCENSTVGGYNDWRLPTKDELGVLYNNREYIGNFDLDTCYWSSSVTYSYSYTYYYMDFRTGNIYLTSVKSYDYNVRAVRSLP